MKYCAWCMSVRFDYLWVMQINVKSVIVIKYTVKIIIGTF
jgi:hypothetical protein